MAERYDAVIIGGGHNGLTTAAYLAKAGWKTLVLEKRPILGGATTSDEIVPGYTFSVLSYVVSLLRPEIIRELELPKHGLEILPLDGTFTPVPGDYLWRRASTVHSTSRRLPVRAWATPTEASAIIFLRSGLQPVDVTRPTWRPPANNGTGVRLTVGGAYGARPSAA